TRVLTLQKPVERFRFIGLPAAPVPSLLRRFSAPVKLKGTPLERLKFLAVHDTDPFARWEASQQVATTLLLDMVAARQQGKALSLDAELVAPIAATLAGAEADPAFAAEVMTLPSESFLADQMATVDVEAIHDARQFARAEIGRSLARELAVAYERFVDPGPYRPDGAGIGRRALRNVCLAYLAAGNGPAEVARAEAQFGAGRNMTDVLAALAVLADLETPARARALAAFYERWRDDELVIDKWFALQALSSLPGTLAEVVALMRHPAFTLKNPNRVRALVATFTQANQLRFHAADGAGYTFLADQVAALD